MGSRPATRHLAAAVGLIRATGLHDEQASRIVAADARIGRAATVSVKAPHAPALREKERRVALARLHRTRPRRPITPGEPPRLALSCSGRMLATHPSDKYSNGEDQESELRDDSHRGFKPAFKARISDRDPACHIGETTDHTCPTEPASGDVRSGDRDTEKGGGQSQEETKVGVHSVLGPT